MVDPTKLSEDQATTKLVEALQAAMALRDQEILESSDTKWNVAKRLIQLKDVALSVGFFASLIGGAFLIYQDLRSKPSTQEVESRIDSRATPIEESLESLESSHQDVSRKLERVEEVQGFQLESQSWESEVLEHLGSKAPGKAPPRPESLKRAERELLQ